MQRVLILGLPGSGKTTLAHGLAAKHGLKHVEVDSFYWGEKWQRVDYDTFSQNIRNYLGDPGDRWVIDNYSSKLVEMGMIDEVDTVILLDLPLHRCMGRVARRSFGRLVGRQKLWDGPTETPLSALKLQWLMTKWHKGLSNTFLRLQEEKGADVQFFRFVNNQHASAKLLD